MKKRIQVLVRELDETGKVVNDEVISEIDPIEIGSPDELSESHKMAWLAKAEQNAIDAASTLKKTLQSGRSCTKKNS